MLFKYLPYMWAVENFLCVKVGDDAKILGTPALEKMALLYIIAKPKSYSKQSVTE